MLRSTRRVIGWDIGGANIKAALVEESGRVVVVERPFALWREPHRLSTVLIEVAEQLGDRSAMAITMTAELADCFATKREGVAFVVQACRTAFPGTPCWFYGVDGTFRPPAIASQN